MRSSIAPSEQGRFGWCRSARFGVHGSRRLLVGAHCCRSDVERLADALLALRLEPGAETSLLTLGEIDPSQRAASHQRLAHVWTNVYRIMEWAACIASMRWRLPSDFTR